MPKVARPLTAAAAAATFATGFKLDKKPDTAPTAAAFIKSPVEIGEPAMFALIAAEAAATPAPTKVLITSDSGELPSGSTRMIGLFSQYANILALRKPLASVVAKVSALMNRQLAKS